MTLSQTSEIKLINEGPALSLNIDKSWTKLAIAQQGDYEGNPSLVLWDVYEEFVIDILASKPFEYIDDVCFSDNWLAYI